MKKMYVHDEILAIPIPKILADYGISVSAYGKFKLRDERTSSAKYYEKTNTFYDFGSSEGGNNINLIMALRHCDKDTAKEILGEDYGVSLFKGDAIFGPTKAQWYDLGIYPEKASMNWEFDLDKPMEENFAISAKLGEFSMNRLKEEKPELYRRVLENRALPLVHEMQADLIELKKSAGKAEKLNDFTHEYLEIQVADAESEYLKTYKVLEKAVKGTGIDIRSLHPDSKAFSKAQQSEREGMSEMDM